VRPLRLWSAHAAYQRGADRHRRRADHLLETAARGGRGAAPAAPSACRAFAGLQQLATQHALAPLGPILSANGGIELDPAQWPTVWFKGGSEPGVLTLGYLATNSKGQTFVVVVMLSDPAAALSPSATPELLAIARGAFELVRNG
jgi:hypothetical protein